MWWRGLYKCNYFATRPENNYPDPVRKRTDIPPATKLPIPTPVGTTLAQSALLPTGTRPYYCFVTCKRQVLPKTWFLLILGLTWINESSLIILVLSGFRRDWFSINLLQRIKFSKFRCRWDSSTLIYWRIWLPELNFLEYEGEQICAPDFSINLFLHFSILLNCKSQSLLL
jgi:hypothetical protein